MSRGMSSRAVVRWKDFEREVVRQLRKLAPKARRRLQFQQGHGVPDVEAGVLWVECKSGKKNLSIETVYRRTAEKAKRGAVPAVVSKAGPRGPKVVTLSLAHFIELAGAPDRLRRRLWRGKP